MSAPRRELPVYLRYDLAPVRALLAVLEACLAALGCLR
jgi:hypothetical protein